ncbi:MAG: hypothetical protein BA870_05700 [Desulfuromonadales bacterium C00003094]|jgi:hypothetical protein|nr:MAG: hypothetical protein BA870_05700 [Desulfuromonadales bacterium C00003094]
MDGWEGGEMKEMMKSCLQKCRWCPLLPIILGTIAFLLGYFLDAEIIRIIWLILSGTMVVMGLLCLLMMRTIRSR